MPPDSTSVNGQVLLTENKISEEQVDRGVQCREAGTNLAVQDSPKISVSSESILGKIKESFDKSKIDGALLNARADLFTNLRLLDLKKNDTKKVEEYTIRTFATLTLLSLCNDPILSNTVVVHKGAGMTDTLLKDNFQEQPIEEAANYIKISAAESNATVTFTPNPKNADEIMGISANYNYGGEGRKTINIELTSPLNMGKIKADALAYILQNQENTTPPNNR